MKKIILLFTVCCFAFSNLSGQKFHFGLHASPGLKWLKPDDEGSKGDGSKLGFSYGVLTEFAFTENYALATGIDVTYRGGRIESTFIDTNGTTTEKLSFNLQYIELPITLKMKTNKIGYMSYFGRFGLVPGVNISAKGSTEIGSVKTSDIDVKDNINSFNLSLMIGLGLEYNLSGNTNLLAGVSFNNGFLDIFDSGNAKSNMLSIDLGVLF